MSLLGLDTSDLKTFSDEVVARADLVALRDRIEIRTDSSLTSTQARVHLRVSGHDARAAADSGSPAEDLAAQRDMLVRKFDALVEPVLGAGRTAELRAAALEVDSLERASTLLELTVPPRSS